MLLLQLLLNMLDIFPNVLPQWPLLQIAMAQNLSIFVDSFVLSFCFPVSLPHSLRCLASLNHHWTTQNVNISNNVKSLCVDEEESTASLDSNLLNVLLPLVIYHYNYIFFGMLLLCRSYGIGVKNLDLKMLLKMNFLTSWWITRRCEK